MLIKRFLAILVLHNVFIELNEEDEQEENL